MERVIEQEWLDELPASEPSAIGSRGDLRRLNWFMNNAGILAGALREVTQPRRVLDLGCGDGALAWRMARNVGWHGVEFLLLDLNVSISSGPRERFSALDCSVTPLRRDVLSGLADIGHVDVVFANLFLHHFTDSDLQRLFEDVSVLCNVFAACEPRRSTVALLGSRCVGLLGCNAVTRHDAIASVRAGFRDAELSRLWTPGADWSLSERPAGLFSHLFIARKL
jgi:SAM-dependent methyltransferase